MRRILVLPISLIIIFTLIFFSLKNKLNIDKIIEDIESNIDIDIELQNKHKWSYYPKIFYKNELSLYGNNGNLIIKNSNINVSKSYKINSPMIIQYQSPSILYKGFNFRDSKIDSEYNNKIINLKKFSANVMNGNIDIYGYLSTNHNKRIALNGSYNNISINRILEQLKIASWGRVKIKLSSQNFSLNSINASPEKIIENLNGEMYISGSILFLSKEEERFGAAFLSILADKFVNMKSMSQLIKYLLDKFADLPSSISGKININEGILTTKKLLIRNQKEKALLTASLNLQSNEITGKIDLYEGDLIFLTAELSGNIQDPKILIGSKTFKKEGDGKPQNIKKIFEEGIQTLIDNILDSNN